MRRNGIFVGKKQALLAMQDANMVQSFLFPQANRNVAKGFSFHP